MDHERREPDPRDRSGRVSRAVERGDGAGLPLGSEARLQAHRHRTDIQVSRRYRGLNRITRGRATVRALYQRNSFINANYLRNEEDVGNAIRKSGIPRKEIFVTTKVPISNANSIE